MSDGGTYRLADWIALFSEAERKLFDLLQTNMGLNDEQAFQFVQAIGMYIREESQS